jgi:valyl-tRNA synthetase
VIEPLPKLQWFVNVNQSIKERGNKTLKQLMHEVVSSQKIKIMPGRFEKIYFNWINNLRDWNISRQLWYGHRIPVWHKGEEIYCGINAPEGTDWVQDEDTLDTWFSSALWTFSTLGWPSETKDLKTFHPTSVMAPGYEILFFWVARMILMSTFLLGEIPFRTVYLHGIVRDITGKKFSKSLDNGIDPVEVINKYGADALRMALVVGVGPGNDSKYDEMKVKGYRNFANKIWNASRFVMQNSEGYDSQAKILPEDQKILDEIRELAQAITQKMDQYDFAHASEDLYHYFWHTFADKTIETAKLRLADDKTKASTQRMLKESLEILLKLLHPFVPFVTETIWQLEHKDLLMVAKWPRLR